MNLAETTAEAIAEATNNQAKEKVVAKQLCRMFFKDDNGKPFDLTDGQADIFLAILLKRDPRVEVITYTQYGKSETVAMATDLRSIVFKEDFTIIAGQQDKSDIIMGKAISHLFDHPALERQIDPLSIPSLERLKHERSRERVTFLDGGEIRSLTASANNRQKVRESVIGIGARNVIEDEASIIPDDLQAMIMRMLGGFKDSFIMKIGNPFYRNHFMKTWQSSRYKKIFIDYHQGIREGRITEDFIEEMRQEAGPFFDVLYECKFPESDEILSGGYRKLIPDTMLEKAFISEEEYQKLCTREIKQGENTFKVPDGQGRLGADFAGGGNDRSAYVHRWPAVMKLQSTNKLEDTMQQVPIVEENIDNYGVNDTDAGLDYGGLGQGITDRLHERDRFVNGVHFGQRSTDPAKYKNARAEMYYLLRQWIAQGGKIVKDDSWYELLSVNYKVDSEKKFQIEPKEDLKKRMKQLGLTVNSPDVADAGALTFASNEEMVEEDDFEFV